VHRGTPILVIDSGSLPTSTENALKSREKMAKGYVLASPERVSSSVMSSLRELNSVHEIGNPDPIQNAIAFARYYDEKTGFGWQTTPQTVEGGKNFLVVNKEIVTK